MWNFFLESDVEVLKLVGQDDARQRRSTWNWTGLGGDKSAMYPLPSTKLWVMTRSKKTLAALQHENMGRAMWVRDNGLAKHKSIVYMVEKRSGYMLWSSHGNSLIYCLMFGLTTALYK